ncbi:MAG: DUF2314 domain-containing protein [Pirellulales bacterium]
MRLAMGVLSLLLCGQLAWAEDAEKLQLDDLQGRWLMVSLRRGGKDAPAEVIKKAQILLEVKGGTFVTYIGGQEVERGKVKLNAASSPATLDQRIKSGKDKGKVQQSIVRIAGDGLQMCQAEVGDERPTEFDSSEGSSHSLAHFERADDDEPGLDIGGTIDVEQDNAKMNEAIAQARKTVGDFIKALRKPGQDQESFSVKMPIQGKEKVEHFWLSEVRFDGKKFHGNIANDPEFVEDVALGDPVSVARDEISDWMYVEGNVLVGGYTIRVLRDGMSEKDRQDLDDSLPFTIE